MAEITDARRRELEREMILRLIEDAEERGLSREDALETLQTRAASMENQESAMLRKFADALDDRIEAVA